MTLDQLRELVERGDIDTVIVGFTDHYGRLMGKRYGAEMFLDDAAAHEPLRLPRSSARVDRGQGFRAWVLAVASRLRIADASEVVPSAAVKKLRDTSRHSG